MSIRRRGNGWQVRVPGCRDRTLPTKEAALTVELDLKLRGKLGALYQEKPTSFGQELDECEARKVAFRDLRPQTIAFYGRCKAPWSPLRDVLIPNLRRSMVEDHIGRRAKNAPVAARNELQFAKAALTEARQRGQNVDEGIFGIRPVKHQAIEGRALTLDELRGLAAWLPSRIYRAVEFTGMVGLRWSEAFRLTDSMLDLDNGRLNIPQELNKGRLPKPVPLTAQEVLLLREQQMARVPGSSFVFANALGGAYSKSGWQAVWDKARERGGQEGLRFHDLRHTAISLQVSAGMPAEVVALRVGHTDGGELIRKRYRHLYDWEMTNALERYEKFVENGRETVAVAS